jgi:membrane protease YdiL (CAAX protease family)
MKNLSSLIIFAIYFTTLVIFETYVPEFVSKTGLTPYRSQKISYILMAMLMIFCFRFLSEEKYKNELFAPPQKNKVKHCLLFALLLAIAGIAMISCQIYAVALISPDSAFASWKFSGKPAVLNIHDEYFGLKSGILNITLFLSTQVLFQPFFEELYFRGLIMKKFINRFSVTTSILLSSLLFTICHPANQYLHTMIYSIFISIYFLIHRNIWLAAIVHGTNNLMSWLYSGFGGMAFIESRTLGELPLLSTWLPEIIIAAVFYAGCIYLLVRTFRAAPLAPLPESDAPARDPA